MPAADGGSAVFFAKHDLIDDLPVGTHLFYLSQGMCWFNPSGVVFHI